MKVSENSASPKNLVQHLLPSDRSPKENWGWWRQEDVSYISLEKQCLTSFIIVVPSLTEGWARKSMVRS